MRQIVCYTNSINVLIVHAVHMLDAPVRDGDILVNPYSLATKPEDLLQPSKLLGQ